MNKSVVTLLLVPQTLTKWHIPQWQFTFYLLFFHLFILSFINFSFVSLMKNRRLGVAANEQVSCHIAVGATNFDKMTHSLITIYFKYTSNFCWYHKYWPNVTYPNDNLPEIYLVFFIHLFVNFSFVSKMKNRRREEAAKQVNCHVAISITKFGTFPNDNFLQINLPFFHFFHSFIYQLFICRNNEKQKTQWSRK